MDPWYPDAIENKAVRNAGRYLAGVPFRGVLHTTESTTFAPRPDSYGGWHQSYPHFTLVERPEGVQIYQHIPIDTAARALRNTRGGVVTNHGRAIQIEIVGRARQSAHFSEAMIEVLARWMRWVEEQTGVRRAAPLAFHGSDAYGLDGIGRMRADQWLAFDAWCGHQHVPENTHWDPGHINIGELLRRGTPPASTAAVSTAQAPVATPGTTYQVVNVDFDALADVRTAPASGQVAFQLASDAAGFQGTGEAREVEGRTWLEIVTLSGSGGWIPANLVAPATDEPASYAVAGVRQDDVLNVRAGAGSGNEVVGAFQPDAGGLVGTGEASYVGRDRWVRVRQTIEGWVNAEYLVDDGEPADVAFDVEDDMDPISHGDVGEDWD